MIAVSNIEHDGKHIEAGTKINTKDFTDEQLDALKLAGAVANPSEGLTSEDKAARIAALEAELASLAEGEVGLTAATPGNAAEKLNREQAIAKLVAEGKSADEATKQVDADIKKAEEAAKQPSK